MPNVYEHLVWNEPYVYNYLGERVLIREQWQQVFGNDHPILLEVACGKGEYAIGLAARYPDRNYVAIDNKGNRLWHGAKYALDHGLKNVVFLRTELLHLAYFFPAQSVSEIWITFADPFPNKRDIKRRLVSPRFMQLFLPLMKRPALFHLKHDNDAYYDYCKEVIKDMKGKIITDLPDVYDKTVTKTVVQEIQTFYEKSHLSEGRIIKYLHWILT